MNIALSDSIYILISLKAILKKAYDGILFIDEAYSLVCEKKNEDFANARYVRNLFENAVKNQASRVAKLSPDVEIEKLKELTIEDFKDEISIGG